MMMMMIIKLPNVEKHLELLLLYATRTAKVPR